MILPFESITPKIGKNCFLAPGSFVIGDVEIGEGSSVWFQSVVRGDVNSIRIGKRTNLQDFTMVHVTNRGAPQPAPTVIGNEVTVGHRATLHGCTVGDLCLVGMGAILLDRAVIGKECVIGAGSLVTEGLEIPAGHLAFGTPAKVIRPLKEEEKEWLKISAEHYSRLARKYMGSVKFKAKS